MSVNLSVRGYEIIVAGLDCTDAVMSFRGSDTKIDPNGLTTFRGELELGRPTGFESIDDRVNNRWALGQPVTVKIADSTLIPKLPPRGGTLFIIDSQYSSKTRKLTLNLGCALEANKIKEPAGDASKVCIGQNTPRTNVIAALLSRAGLSFAGSVPGLLNAPTPKLFSGSYVEQAGKIAAAAGYFLYTHTDGRILAASVGNKSAPLSFVITNGAIAFHERLKGAIAPGKVSVQGNATIVTQGEDFTQYTSVDVGSGAILGLAPNSRIVLRRSTTTDSFDRNTKTRTVYTIVEEPVGLLFPDDPGFAGRTEPQTSEIIEEKYYYETNSKVLTSNVDPLCQQGNQGRLQRHVKSTVKPQGIPLAAVIASYPATSTSIPSKTAFIEAEREEKTYFYGSKSVISAISSGGGDVEADEDRAFINSLKSLQPIISTIKYKPIGEILPDEYSYRGSSAPDNPQRMIPSEATNQTWTEIRLGEWELVEVTRRPLAVANSQAADAIRDRARPQQENWPFDRLVDTLSSLSSSSTNRTLSNSGQAQPPAPDTYPPEKDMQDISVTGSARLPSNASSPLRPPKEDMSFEYLSAVSTEAASGRAIARAEAQRLAAIWGIVRWGQYKGTSYTTDLSDDWWNYTPGCRIDVYEPESRFSYLADGFAIALAGTRCVVSFDGLYLGQVVSTSYPPGANPQLLPPPPIDTPIEELAIIPPYVNARDAEIACGCAVQTAWRAYSSAIALKRIINVAGGSAVQATEYYAQGRSGATPSIALTSATVAPSIIEPVFVSGGTPSITLFAEDTEAFSGVVATGETPTISLTADSVATIRAIDKSGSTPGIALYVATGSYSASNLDPDTATLLSRFGGTYSSSRQTAINDFIAGLKTDGLWATIDCLYILAAPIEGDALLNWKSSSYTLTKNGSPTFTADRGFANGGNSANHLRTGFVPSTAGGNYTQNSATFGVYSRTNTDSLFPIMGSQQSGILSRLFLRYSGDNQSFGEINSSSVFASAVGAVTNSQGLFLICRTASTAGKIYRNGTAIATGSAASSGLSSHQFFILASNNAGTATGTSPHQIAASVIASGWNDTQASNFNTRLQTYLTAIGANV